METIAVAAVEYELTPEDWEEVNALHLFESGLYSRALRQTRVLTALLFATLALFSLVLGSGWTAALFVLAALGVPGLIGPAQRRAQRRALRALTQQGIANGTFGRHRVEVRDEGLFHATSAFESLFRWHGIEEVRERNGNFLVYIGPNAFLPIPATAFGDSRSLRQFADAFYARVGQRQVASGEAVREA